MNEFKVGDRVTPVDEEKAGDDLTYGEVYTVTRVERPCVLDRVYLREVENGGTSEGWFAGGRFRLAPAPRKDTPKAGDTVRVVLEGKVEAATDEGWFRVGIAGGNLIQPATDHVRSVEILEPAKPSVKDLPAFAFVQNMDTGEVVRRRGRTDTWVSLDNLAEEFRTGEIDGTNWAQLVPQESA